MLRAIDTEKCIGCGSCFKSCSFDVYRLNTHQEKVSPCTGICPIGTDMRSYIHLLQQGKHFEAAEELLQYNPMPLLTCRICSHYCEKACTRAKIDASVNIPALEDYLGHWIIEHEPHLPEISRAGKVAVLGSGAAGLSAAYFMRKYGCSVVVYEKENTLGGQLADKISQEILTAQIDWLKRCGIEFVTGTAVGDNEALTIEKLREDHVRAVIIATGKDTAHNFKSVIDIADNKIEADTETLETRTKYVFAVGAVRGASHEPVHEIFDGREAAFSAHRFLDGWDLLESRPAKKREIAAMPVDKLFQYSEELPIGTLPATPRNEVPAHKIYDYETMILEANRCVTCGAKAEAKYKNDCMTCYFCEIACPVNAIIVDPIKEKQPRTIEFEREGV